MGFASLPTLPHRQGNPSPADGGEDYPMPATIDDPAVLGEINAALANAGYGERNRG
jgi:hypothetical protein